MDDDMTIMASGAMRMFRAFLIEGFSSYQAIQLVGYILVNGVAKNAEDNSQT